MKKKRFETGFNVCNRTEKDQSMKKTTIDGRVRTALIKNIALNSWNPCLKGLRLS